MKKVTVIPIEDYKIGPTYQLVREDPIFKECYLQEGVECEGGLEREHVIPRVLFAPDAVGDPILLSACSKHNRMKGRVDEAAARIMQLTAEKGGRRRYERWLNYSKSHFQQDGNVRSGGRFLKEIMSSLSLRDITTPAGIVLHSNRPSIKIKDNPINELFIAITKGLIVRETGRFFNWGEYEFHLDCAQTIDRKNRIIDDPAHSIYMAYKNRTFSREWPGVFAAFGATVKSDRNDDYAAAWGMVGYTTHAAVILVLPKSDQQKMLF